MNRFHKSRKHLLAAVMKAAQVETQTALAAKVGVSQGQLWEWFFRNQEFPIRAAKLLSKATNDVFPKSTFRPDAWDPPEPP